MTFISKPKVLNTKLPKNELAALPQAPMQDAWASPRSEQGPGHAADADARKASAGLLAEQERSEEGGEATQNLRFSQRGC